MATAAGGGATVLSLADSGAGIANAPFKLAGMGSTLSKIVMTPIREQSLMKESNIRRKGWSTPNNRPFLSLAQKASKWQQVLEDGDRGMRDHRSRPKALELEIELARIAAAGAREAEKAKNRGA
ncbi:hypothetical protein EV426DRAFT_718012 [Tirmania nivea]|nr:hypothetical protein EV426DRAFT_718012 [Tirmania nivea]